MRWSTPVLGMYRLKMAAVCIEYGDKEYTSFRYGIHTCVYEGKVER